jgi:hypothetical protein
LARRFLPPRGQATPPARVAQLGVVLTAQPGAWPSTTCPSPSLSLGSAGWLARGPAWWPSRSPRVPQLPPPRSPRAAHVGSYAAVAAWWWAPPVSPIPMPLFTSSTQRTFSLSPHAAHPSLSSTLLGCTEPPPSRSSARPSSRGEPRLSPPSPPLPGFPSRAGRRLAARRGLELGPAPIARGRNSAGGRPAALARGWLPVRPWRVASALGAAHGARPSPSLALSPRRRIPRHVVRPTQPLLPVRCGWHSTRPLLPVRCGQRTGAVPAACARRAQRGPLFGVACLRRGAPVHGATPPLLTTRSARPGPGVARSRCICAAYSRWPQHDQPAVPQAPACVALRAASSTDVVPIIIIIYLTLFSSCE